MPSKSPEILTADLIARVRRIEVTTRKLVADGFAGEYHSVFKGHGMEFDEVRRYSPGDDVRDIDWNVTARTGEPHIKSYIEERELTVMLAVDVSRSGEFGTQESVQARVGRGTCGSDGICGYDEQRHCRVASVYGQGGVAGAATEGQETRAANAA